MVERCVLVIWVVNEWMVVISEGLGAYKAVRDEGVNVGRLLDSIIDYVVCFEWSDCAMSNTNPVTINLSS